MPLSTFVSLCCRCMWQWNPIPNGTRAAAVERVRLMQLAYHCTVERVCLMQTLPVQKIIFQMACCFPFHTLVSLSQCSCKRVINTRIRVQVSLSISSHGVSTGFCFWLQLQAARVSLGNGQYKQNIHGLLNSNNCRQSAVPVLMCLVSLKYESQGDFLEMRNPCMLRKWKIPSWQMSFLLFMSWQQNVRNAPYLGRELFANLQGEHCPS